MKQHLLLIGFLVWATMQNAQAQPANNTPCTATPLTGNVTCNYTVFDNTGATNTAGVPGPGCGGTNPGEQDVWFTVTVPASGNLIIDTDQGSLTDMAMAVYSAPSCGGPFTLILCDDNGSGAGMPMITLTGQTPGTTLYVRLWDFYSPGFFGIGVNPREYGTFSICLITPPPPPFNDNPCQATPLIAGTNCNFILSNNINALNSSGIPAPGCGGTNPGQEDVWFVLQVPSTGAVSIQTAAGTLNNMAMAVYSASTCSGPFTLVSCNANGANMPTLSLTGQTPGSYLFVRLWDEYNPGFLGIGVDPLQQGTFSICAQTVQPSGGGGSGGGGSYNCATTPPAGNTCETATQICTFNGYCGTTQGYTANYWFQGSQGLGGPLTANGIFCGSIENNSFISFIAGATSVNLDVIVSGSAINCADGVQFMMFGDPTGAPACGSLNIVSYGCQSPMAPGTNNFTATGLTPGQQYYLMVDGFAGDICQYQINALSGVLINMSAGADRTICLGQSVDLTLLGAGAGTVNWTGPFLNTTTGTTVTATPNAVGTYQYIATAPTLNPACSGPTGSDTVLVTVVAAPPLNLSQGPCNNGQVMLTASGANTYTWLPTQNINQTSGSTVVVSPSAPTQYIVLGSNGACLLTDTLLVQASDDATIYPASFCLAQGAVQLSAGGTPGGTWSGTGITNASNGTFDPSVAGIGNHIVTYTTSGGCSASDTALITVTAGSTANIAAATFCLGAPAQNLSMTGTVGGAWSGAGIVDATAGTFSPSSAGVGTHTVSYSVSGACPVTATQNIVVVPDDQAQVSDQLFCLAQAAVQLSATGTQGGTWSGAGITNASNGTFDPTVAGIGNHTIIYTTSGSCPTSDTATMTVQEDGSANIVQPGALCADAAPISLSVSGSQGGAWSGPGTSAGGIFDPSAAGAGTHAIVYQVGGSCPASDTAFVTVNALDQASIAQQSFCPNQAPAALSLTGSMGGVWSGAGITDATAGTFDPGTVGPGSYTITYQSVGLCPISVQTVITVFEADEAQVADATLCLNSSNLQLELTGTPGGTWSGTGIVDASGGWFSASIAGLGLHQVQYLSPGNCPVTAAAWVEVGQVSVTASFGSGNAADTIFLGETVQLNAQGNPNWSYLWSSADAAAGINAAASAQSSAQPQAPGSYLYAVIAGDGLCSDTFLLQLMVYNNGLIGIPSAFTPNGDGQNDLFRPIGYEQAQVSAFKVFNRWGETVYDNPSAAADGSGWDGTFRGQQQPREVYLYIFEYRFPWENQSTVLRGEVTLIR